MSYTPPDQYISGSITQILEGMTAFEEAAAKRAQSEDWEESHLEDLAKARLKILHLRVLLEEMARNNH